MTIPLDNLRLEVEAEAPRNRVTFGSPPDGFNAQDLYDSTNWTAQNSAVITQTTNKEMQVRKVSPTANQVVAVSPYFTATPGEYWQAAFGFSTITEGTDINLEYRAEAFNGSTSLGIMATAPRASVGLVTFLTPAGTTRVRFSLVSISTSTFTVKLYKYASISRSPAQFNGWTSQSADLTAVGTTFFKITAQSATAAVYRTSPVTPGQWVAAALDPDRGGGSIHTAFYRSNGTMIADTERSATYQNRVGRIATEVIQAPADAATVRLTIKPRERGTGNSSSAPIAGSEFWFNELVLNVEDQKLFAERTTWEQSTRPNNLLPNSSGEFGGSFGWVTPSPGATLNVVENTPGYPRLQFKTPSTPPDQVFFYSEPQPVTPGKYIGASWEVSTVVEYRQVIEFLDAGFNVISSTTQTVDLIRSARFFTEPRLIPTGANYARLRFQFGYNSTGNIALTNAAYFYLSEAVLAMGDTAEQASGLPYIESIKWLDIIKPVHEISITRAELDVGTMNATVMDPDLDPAQAPDVRPGKAVRVTAKTPAGVWEPLYKGVISNASTTYDSGTRITLTASDGIKQVANAVRPVGVGTIAELPAVLEGTGVPFKVNGSQQQVGTFITVSKNDNTSALDQVAITRDTALGYAWVDRNNVLVVNDASSMSTAIAGVIDESVYRNPEIDFNTDSCINEVIVKFMRYNGTDSEEIIYGPYRDAASIAKWGRYSAEYTIQRTVESSSAIAAYAKAILTANANPRIRINTADIAITKVADLTTAKAFLDLYDLVNVKYAAKSVNENSRITGITHTITPGNWDMQLLFGVDGSVAASQLTPSPPANAGANQIIPVTASRSRAGRFTMATNTTGTSKRVNFDTAFPAGTEVAVLCQVNTDSPTSIEIFQTGAGAADSTGFTAVCKRSSGSNAASTFHYIATALG